MIKPYYETELGKLYHGDSMEIVSTLPRCDLVFTSPPYDMQRDYESFFGDWSEVMSEIFLNLQIKKRTQVVINLGLIYRNNNLKMYWQDFLYTMIENKWNLYGLYVWDQCEGLPGHFKGRFSKSFEFLFHLNRNRIDINKTKKCKTAGRKHFPGREGLLMKNGERRNVRKLHVTGKYKIPRDIVKVPRDKGHRTGHPAVFPVGLPQDIILAMTKKGQTVLDPFMGTGTTALASEYLNRKWLGVEISEKYCEIAAKRIEKITDKLEMCSSRSVNNG